MVEMLGGRQEPANVALSSYLDDILTRHTVWRYWMKKSSINEEEEFNHSPLVR